MNIGMFDSVYSETILSLLGHYAKGAAITVMKDGKERDYPKHFDVFIINRMPPRAFAGRVISCGCAVVDSDDARILSRLRRCNTNIVTYGFNSRASVTISGVTSEESPFGLNVAFCLRRSVKRPGGGVVLQQEFMVDTVGIPFIRTAIKDISEPSFVARCLMPAVSAAIITGRDK